MIYKYGYSMILFHSFAFQIAHLYKNSKNLPRKHDHPVHLSHPFSNQLIFLVVCYSSHYIIFLLMNQNSEIIDLSGLNSPAILENIQKLLEESDFDRFTLVLQRREKKTEQTFRERASKKRAETKYSVFGNTRCLTEISSRFGQRNSEETEQIDEGLGQGLALYQQGEFEEALQSFKQYEKLLRQGFGHECESLKLYQDLIFHMGNCYYRLKDFSGAIEYYSRKFQAEELKQQGQRYNNLGSCYAHLQQSRLSLTNYALALKVYSSFPEIDCSNLLNNLGVLYSKSKMFDVAQRYFLQSIEQRKLKSPDNAYLLYSSYLQLGNCQKNSGKLQQAVSSLQLALNFAERGFGSEAETLYQLATIYQLLEKWEKALNCYQKLSQMQTRKGYLYERAAHVHRLMGHVTDFDRFIQKAYQSYKDEKDQRKLSEIMPIVVKTAKK